jgi:hypothetical protein
MITLLSPKFPVLALVVAMSALGTSTSAHQTSAPAMTCGRAQKRRLEPLEQILKQRRGSLVANFSALIGRPAAYLLLDPVQDSDSLKGLSRNRRSVRLLQVVKLAPNVRPTRRFLNASSRVKLIEPCSSQLTA